MDNLKALFLAIVGNLITPFVVTLGGIAVGYFSPFTNELKLIIFNTALILSAIILILSHKYSPHRVRVVKTQIANDTYLVRNNVARHIPDAETVSYLGQIYGFHWGEIETISHDDFQRQFSKDSTLPSILPHCQAFYQRIREQTAQKRTE